MEPIIKEYQHNNRYICGTRLGQDSNKVSLVNPKCFWGSTEGALHYSIAFTNALTIIHGLDSILSCIWSFIVKQHFLYVQLFSQRYGNDEPGKSEWEIVTAANQVITSRYCFHANKLISSHARTHAFVCYHHALSRNAYTSPTRMPGRYCRA